MNQENQAKLKQHLAKIDDLTEKIEPVLKRDGIVECMRSMAGAMYDFASWIETLTEEECEELKSFKIF